MEPSRIRSVPDEISLHDLWLVIAAQKILIFSLAICFGVIVGAASFAVTPTFRADVLLADSEGDGFGSGSKSAAAGALGNFASLAGIYSESGGESAVSVATLSSRMLTDRFIADKGLLPVLFSSQWDQQNQKWKNSDVKKQPTLWDADRLFGKVIRNVVVDKKTELVTLTITWTDPVQAADWANELVARTNTMLRTKAVERSNRNVQYLQQQLDKTTVIEVRQSIYRLMENEIKTLTLAEGAEEYAFKVIDPAVVPHRRSAPNRILYALSGILLGLVAGVIIALMRNVKR